MAKFLKTTGISFYLEEIIREAKEQLILVSPFLRVNDQLKALLEDKDRLRIDVRVIYGKNELQPEEHDWLESLSYIRTSFRKNLHAKCYLNENKAMLTSMNLYEYSQINNDEMGILVVRNDEPDLYDEIFEQVRWIERNSEPIRITVARGEAVAVRDEVDSSAVESPRTENGRRRGSATVTVSATGVCIRCGESIPLDPAKPCCERCFRSWNRYKNAAYEEERCHICEKERTTSMSKPACLDCYRKYKDVIDFAS